MDELDFTEAESNMNDLVSEYQQYQGNNTFCLDNTSTSHFKNKNNIFLFVGFTTLGTFIEIFCWFI